MKINVQYTAQEAEHGWDLLIRPVDISELRAEQETDKQAAQGNDPLSVLAIRQALADLSDRGVFKAKNLQVERMPLLGLYSSARAAFIGLDSSTLDADEIRSFGAAAAKEIRSAKSASARLLITAPLYSGTSGCTTLQAAQALAEGLLLGAYERIKTLSSQPKTASAIAAVYLPEEVSSEVREQWEEGIRRGIITAGAVEEARNLVHLPANELTPEVLAEHAERLASEFGFDYEVLDEYSAHEQGMGGLLAVGKGSMHPPRMIVMHYDGNPDSSEKWGVIGKGITFDTGGYSLKRAPGMEDMISDMAGAAAVLGAMRIIGEQKPKVNIVAVIPTAENMISERAFKPGDVITMMNGMTVEIVNTDAEGRLVLADGLTTAIRRGATRLVDVATLTGAVVAALGDSATGVMSTDDAMLSQLQEASKRTGERVWPLPAYSDYRKLLDSDAADLKNGAGRYGAASIAGMFINAFAEEKPWLHLDIAGTAWLTRSRGWESKGATGVMVRTLAELLLRD